MERTSTSPRIQSIRSVVWKYMWNEWRLYTLIVLGASLGIALYAPSIVLALAPPLLYSVFLFQEAQTVFMRAYAKAHHLTYKKSLPLSAVKGRLFSVGHSKRITHALIGTIASYKSALFFYQYTTGSGKNAQQHPFTIVELQFDTTVFPHILLLSKTMQHYGSRDYFGSVRDVEISLEGAHSDAYSLHTTIGYETEALQIFTPDFLLFLEKEAKELSIEFSENRIYLYDDYHIGTYERLRALHRVAEEIIARAGPLLERLHDDFAALHPYFKEER